MALSACAMPSLETGSNLLAVPPGGNERAALTSQPEPAMAVQSSAEQATGEADPVLLAASSQDAPPPQNEKILEPMPPDGVMQGEFWGNSVAFADRDGLVCAGRLLSYTSELNRGLSVPVNCSDGSAGKFKIVALASPKEAEGVVVLSDKRSAPVRLVRSENIE